MNNGKFGIKKIVKKILKIKYIKNVKKKMMKKETELLKKVLNCETIKTNYLNYDNCKWHDPELRDLYIEINNFLNSLPKEIPLNDCLHCKGGSEIDKECCNTCGGKGKVKKHIHKGARWRYNYPICDPNCTQDYAMVTRRWELVTCPKCLQHKKEK